VAPCRSRNGQYPRTTKHVIGLQRFLWDKLTTWANNGNCVEDIRNKFKDIIFEGVERFVPHKILKRNPDPEYY